MGFNRLFFIALLAVCIVRGAWAECCWCDCPTTGCLCPSGIDFDGYDGYGTPICVNPCPNADCSYCGEQPGAYCDGYDDPCPFGETPGKKCKKIGNCPAPCQLYERCDTANGATEQQMSGACHVENNTCYSNTRACRDFSNRVETNGTTSMSCNPEMQQGNAVWQQNENAWYTGGCECKRDNVENTGLLRCERVNARAYVKNSDTLVTHSVNDDIIYTLEYMYCAKCHPGYLPNIVTGQNANYLHPSNTNSDWGVLTCATAVSVPDYAPGCVINFNLSMDGMMAECRKTCPDGFATESDGATSVGECQYDEHTTYTDDTGTFYIGSLDDCP